MYMDLVKTYFKGCINENNTLNNIKLYCRHKIKEGNQIMIEFFKKFGSQSLYTLRIHTFKNYVKTNEEFKTITQYGKVENILTTLFFYELNLSYPNGKKYPLIIGLGIDEELPINSIEFIYDKSDKNFNSNECPVCKVDWGDRETIKLPCDHVICRDCFLSLVFHNKYKRDLPCPVCRKNTLSTINY